jgi:hypothetical protein
VKIVKKVHAFFNPEQILSLRKYLFSWLSFAEAIKRKEDIQKDILFNTELMIIL